MLARQTLDLRQQQKLVLTPQLQQSIKLLQLSGAELEQEVVQALLDNPMLERIDDPSEYGIKETESLNQTEADILSLLGFPNPSSWEGEQDWRPEAAVSESLAAYLERQLGTLRLSQRERALAQLIIDELDDNAYLETGLHELLSYLPTELEIELVELEDALDRVQSLDPPGVAARDLAECLLLQLWRMGEKAPDKVTTCAQVMIQEHLASLSSSHQLGQALGERFDSQTLKQAHKLVLFLDPKPGRAWAQNTAQYIVPDVIVRQEGSQWLVRLNPYAVPRLRLAQIDEHAILQSRNLQQERQKAGSMIRGIAQRFTTVLRVADAIVQHQQAFFIQGQAALRPLQLRNLASSLALHESTISRATRQKYIQTPLGMFELKYFFSTALHTHQASAEVSAAAIRARIAALIRTEPVLKPYSDQKLADKLHQEGVSIARRTVAKYRELEGLEAASQRKMRASLVGLGD